jgi:hypothetical protein
MVKRRGPPSQSWKTFLLNHALEIAAMDLNKDAPFHRAIQRLGAITSQPVLAGLHHQYCRI